MAGDGRGEVVAIGGNGARVETAMEFIAERAADGASQVLVVVFHDGGGPGSRISMKAFGEADDRHWALAGAMALRRAAEPG